MMTDEPVLAGRVEVGRAVFATLGQWSETPTQMIYRWERCRSATDCEDIAGATGRTYTLRTMDVGSRVRVTVTAVSDGQAFTGTPITTPLSAVVTRPNTKVSKGAPFPAVTPRFTGGKRAGQDVTIVQDWAFANAPTSIEVQIERCEVLRTWDPPAGLVEKDGPCVAVDSLTRRSRVRDDGTLVNPDILEYTLDGGFVPHDIRAVVIATNAAGSTRAQTVRMRVLAPKETTSMLLGPATPGQVVRAPDEWKPGTWDKALGGRPDEVRYRWLRCNAKGYDCVVHPLSNPAAWRQMAEKNNMRQDAMDYIVLDASDRGTRIRVERTPIFRNAGDKAPDPVISSPSMVVE